MLDQVIVSHEMYFVDLKYTFCCLVWNSRCMYF